MSVLLFADSGRNVNIIYSVYSYILLSIDLNYMQTAKIFSVFFLFFFILGNVRVNSQNIKVDTDKYTYEQLIREVLITGSVQVSGIKYTGDKKAIGYFSEGDPDVCFDSGIVLSTGLASQTAGPNNNTATQTAFYQKGDPDLNKIIGNNSSKDAAVLEFDFISQADSIRFEYIFGSEEYPEYVKNGFNDVFGFFLSGKNPKGGNYDKINLALLPGSQKPVSIDNLNQTDNKQLYVNNAGGKNIEFDGLTKPLIAGIKVIKGEKYHIKLAISDVGDYSFDSGVFLKATSFFSGSNLEYTDVCFGTSTKFKLSSPEGIDSCLWNFGDTDSGSDNFSKEYNTEHLFTKNGEFNVSLISYHHSTSDTVSEKIKIIGFHVNLGPDKIIKPGENLVLDAGVDGIYKWSTGETSKTINVSQAGTYSVNVDFGNGCIVSSSVKVSFEEVKCSSCCLPSLIFATLIALTCGTLFFVCKKQSV